MTLSTYEKSPISSEKPSKVEKHPDYCSSKFATGGSIDSLFRNERQKKRKHHHLIFRDVKEIIENSTDPLMLIEEEELAVERSESYWLRSVSSRLIYFQIHRSLLLKRSTRISYWLRDL